MNHCDSLFCWLLLFYLIAIIAITSILLSCCTTDARIPCQCPISLYITGPSKCPQVDIPHLASVAGTLSAVAGRARREIVQVVWNCLCCWLAVSQGYFESEWRTEPVSCSQLSQARTKPENQPIPSSAVLNHSNNVNIINKLNNINDIFNTYNCKNCKNRT